MKRSCGLESYQVHIVAAEVAHKRVANHLRGMTLVDYSLNQLAVNCYLQGCQDMAEALIRNGYVLPDDEVRDYQI